MTAHPEQPKDRTDINVLAAIDDFEIMLQHNSLKKCGHFVINRLIKLGFYILYRAWDFKCIRIEQGGEGMHGSAAKDPRDG